MNAIDVHQAWQAFVHGKQGIIGRVELRRYQVRPDVRARCEVKWRVSQEIDLEQVIVLVSARILKVEDVFAIALPPSHRDGTRRVMCHQALVRLPYRLDPNAQFSISRCQIGEHLAVRRQSCPVDVWIAKENTSRNQR